MNYLDWILSFGSFIMLWLMGNKHPYAPIVGIFNQVLWIAYVIQTKHWGLFPGVLGYTFIHIRNVIKWQKEAE